VIDGFGNELDNVIIGNSSRNVLFGHEGNDILIGGGGNDEYRFPDSSDTIIEEAGGGIDTVVASFSFSLVGIANVERLQLVSVHGGNGTGNELDNEIIGSNGANVLDGAAGADLLLGGFGGDTLTGGAHADRFVYALISDTRFFPGAFDVILDFDPTEGDRIDVSQLDANELVAGVQDWTFIGTADFTAAGQVRVIIAGGDTFLAFSTDTETDDEAAIRIIGLPAMDATAFIL
jgi:serralysin